MSYFAVLGVIKQNITPESFRIFCFIKYRLQKKLSCTQDIIGDELGVSQQLISYHINHLIIEKYLEKEHTNNNNNNIYFNSNYYKANH
jgi:predicted transcriptional regulator